MILTREHVERAIRREGISHPVISTMDRYADRIRAFNAAYQQVDKKDAQKWARDNLGFLADAIEWSGEFPVGSLDIIAIWSKADELELKNRYALAGMVSTAYSIQGAPADWRGLPRYYLENGKLPESVIRDKHGLVYVDGRLGEVRSNLDEIEIYRYGVKDPMRQTAELAKRARGGDAGADRELERLIAIQDEHDHPAVSYINENFGNGMLPLRLAIGDALRELEK